MAVGEEVTICSEDSDSSLRVVAEGKIRSLGDNLELFLEGRPEPVTGGRLILGRRWEDYLDLNEASSVGADTV